MIHLQGQYWAVEVPDDAWILKSENYRTDFVINMGYILYPTVGKKKWLSMPGAPGLKMPGLDYNERSKGAIKLPEEGSWSIVCTSNEVKVEHAVEIVEAQDEVFYKCYGGNRPHVTAVGSFRCLLASRSCGCNLNITYLILKKQ